MIRFAVILLLAGCAGHPYVPDPRNPDLSGAPATEEPEDQCFAGPETARIRILCDQDLTAERLTELQRALAARDLYDGPADGRNGPATREAVRKYQAIFGRDDPQLTWAAAEALGLVAVEVAPVTAPAAR